MAAASGFIEVDLAKKNNGASASSLSPEYIGELLKLIDKPKKKAMKPSVVADEMFPEGAGAYMDVEEAGGSTALLMDLAANEKSVHADFFNDFEDLFDDEDVN